MQPVVGVAHPETEIKQNKIKLPTVGWNGSPGRRQFCFISVLFHHVRRA